jgi:RNA polymerase sigma-70 factor (ECF subfamily)
VRPSDIVQAALLEAMRDLPKFRGAGDQEFEGWLFSILHHTLQDQGKYFAAERRAVQREQRLSPSSAERLTGSAATPSSVAGARESEARHTLALESLSEDHQSVLRMREIDQLDFRTIGERMSRSETAARTLHLRARQALAQRVRELRL